MEAKKLAHPEPSEILERISQGLLVVSPDHEVILWNERFREIFELPHDLLRPGLALKDLTDLLYERGDLSLAKQDPDVRREVEEFRRHQAFELPLANGRVLDVRREPVPGGSIVTTYTDVTDRKRAEIALRDSEARYRQLVDGSVQGMLIVRGGRPVFANERFTFLLGYSMDEILAMESALELIPDHKRGEFRGRLDKRLSGEEVASEYEFELVRKDGSTFWAQAHSEVIEWDDAAAVQTTIVDITERREIADLQDRFLAATSHELKTPLSALDGSLGYLADTSEALDPEQRALLQVGLSSVRRMERLVDSLLRFVSLGGEDPGLSFSTIELHPLLTALVAEHGKGFSDVDVVLELDDKCPGFLLSADAGALAQAFSHLLDNARDFAPANTTVRVLVEAEDSGVRISISDDGVGVPDEIGDRVFDRFWQGSPQGRRVHDGVGLGLALAKEVITHHGGAVGYVRDMQRGATFFVDLPGAET